MSEEKKAKWQKTWSELSEDERNQEEWYKRVKRVCPLTRKPCFEKINPESGDDPENYVYCKFQIHDELEACALLDFLEAFEDFGSLVKILGVKAHKDLFGRWPSHEKREGGGFWPWEWEI